MKYISPSHLTRILNIGLRLASLGTKMVLTLYIARYLNLSAMGYYGLVSGSVFILMVILGMRFDYVVSRELVGATPLAALTKMRDQMVFYSLNQAVLALAMTLIVVFSLTNISARVMLIIFILSVLENWGDTIFLNLISLGRPLVANLVFFVRSAFWVFPVIGLGLFLPEYRTTRFIFMLWIAGSSSSLFIALFVWRSLPWREAFNTPVNWEWIRISVKRCFFIWISAIGGTAGYYLDRFVLAHNMTLELAGVATFYTSFGGSLFALIHSGVLSFAYPHLISLHKAGDKAGYQHEVNKLMRHVAFLAGILGTLMGIVIPFVSDYFHRPEFSEHAWTLWLILFATWIRCISEVYYYMLFSRGQDRALWVGGLFYLFPSLCFNLILVPLIGFSGIGYSAVLSNMFLLMWRAYHIYKKSAPSIDPNIETIT